MSPYRLELLFAEMFEFGNKVFRRSIVQALSFSGIRPGELIIAEMLGMLVSFIHG